MKKNNSRKRTRTKNKRYSRKRVSRVSRKRVSRVPRKRVTRKRVTRVTRKRRMKGGMDTAIPLPMGGAAGPPPPVGMGGETDVPFNWVVMVEGSACDAAAGVGMTLEEISRMDEASFIERIGICAPGEVMLQTLILRDWRKQREEKIGAGEKLSPVKGEAEGGGLVGKYGAHLQMKRLVDMDPSEDVINEAIEAEGKVRGKGTQGFQLKETIIRQIIDRIEREREDEERRKRTEEGRKHHVKAMKGVKMSPSVDEEKKYVDAFKEWIQRYYPTLDTDSTLTKYEDMESFGKFVGETVSVDDWDNHLNIVKGWNTLKSRKEEEGGQGEIKAGPGF
tara:strand:+ start:561 stop:1562 length:1002 start_codon:yes stop_codon:yes gene_type:complete